MRSSTFSSVRMFLVVTWVTSALLACHSGDDADKSADAGGDTVGIKKGGDGSITTLDPCKLAMDPTPNVDGQFTGWPAAGGKFGTKLEYANRPPVEGKYGWFYIAVPDCNSFYLINDWYVRNDAPICPAMYNLFRFSTGGGHQQWQVRVYGDGHLDILLNDQPYTNGKGGFSYGPSPNAAKPHTIFEFGVTGVESGELAAQLHDPASAATLYVSDPSPTPGCANPEGALLREPTILTANLVPGAEVQLTPATAPIAVMLTPFKVQMGDEVTIYGGMFGDKPGSVSVGGVLQTITSWTDGEIHLTLGGTLYGEQRVVVYAKAGQTNELWLELPPPPICDDGVLCTVDVSVNGECESTPSDSLCNDGDACTTDSCSQKGCVYTPVASPGCPCQLSGSFWCDCESDADCDSGYCVAGPTGRVCTKPCTNTCPEDWACSATAGNDNVYVCTWLCVASKELCNGIDDDCDGIVDNPAGCDDENPCTLDGCGKGSSGCVHTYLDGKACSDGNACTAQDMCMTGSCEGFEVICDDGNQCTSELCSPMGAGCVFTPLSGDPGGCDDGSVCTVDDTCLSGKCGGKSKIKGATDCQAASCNPVTGVVTVQPFPKGTPCDDGKSNTVCDACTGDSTCVGVPEGSACD